MVAPGRSGAVRVGPVDSVEGEDRRERARRAGRRVGLGVFAAIVTAFTSICTFQIVSQVWFPPASDATLSCKDGVRELVTAVRKGRESADGETGGEKAAMDRFRTELEGAWSREGTIARRCAPDRTGARAVVTVRRWRYAEEHAVRYGAIDLAPRRREIASLEQGWLAEP